MTPEEAAVWLRGEIREQRARLLEGPLFCDCSGRHRSVSAVYVAGGDRILWVAGPDGTWPDSRALPLDSPALKGATQTEATECPRCRRGVVLVVRNGRVDVMELGAPTRGVVTD